MEKRRFLYMSFATPALILSSSSIVAGISAGAADCRVADDGAGDCGAAGWGVADDGAADCGVAD
jgi:hypothetical protein